MFIYIHIFIYDNLKNTDRGVSWCCRRVGRGRRWEGPACVESSDMLVNCRGMFRFGIRRSRP